MIEIIFRLSYIFAVSDIVSRYNIGYDTQAGIGSSFSKNHRTTYLKNNTCCCTSLPAVAIWFVSRSLFLL